MPCQHPHQPDGTTSRPLTSRAASATVWGVLGGVAALAWLLARTGSKPSRLGYPCQQASLAAASAVLGGPIVTAAVAGNARIRQWLLTTRGRAVLLGIGLSAFGWLGFTGYEPAYQGVIASPPPGYRAAVYAVKYARGAIEDRFGGVDDLITLMGGQGSKWYRSAVPSRTSGPEGLIGADDVVLVKINAQWSQRGGTNTDVVRGILARIVDHPDGFVGEIVVADNGQRFGHLDRTQNNADDITQSPQDIVNDFAVGGWRVSTKLWDAMRDTPVDEFASGNNADGYVVSASLDPESSIRVSYPKFQTPYGTFISYKYGIWDPAAEAYDEDRLVVINVPVLKTHAIYGVTAAVKNHMGVVTQGLNTDSHYGVARGGLGSVLAEVRMPDLTILDCIWIMAHPGSGPSASYAMASRRNQLVAGRDPVALDMWATANILIPQIIENGHALDDYAATQDPDNPTSVFRRYLDRSMSEMIAGGIETTHELSAIDAVLWAGDANLDGDLDTEDWFAFSLCSSGPEQWAQLTCRTFDFDTDWLVDLSDFARFQTVFTGSSASAD